MHVTLVDEDGDPLGSFVLRNGKVEIDCPPAELFMFKEILGEEILSLDENFDPGPPVTSTSDPVGWMRGLLLQYNSYKLRAELEEE